MGERPQGGGTGTTGNGMVVICDLLDFAYIVVIGIYEMQAMNFTSG